MNMMMSVMPGLKKMSERQNLTRAKLKKKKIHR